MFNVSISDLIARGDYFWWDQFLTRPAFLHNVINSQIKSFYLLKKVSAHFIIGFAPRALVLIVIVIYDTGSISLGQSVFYQSVKMC